MLHSNTIYATLKPSMITFAAWTRRLNIRPRSPGQNYSRVCKPNEPARISALIAQKRANTYEEAVSILKDLHDLAAHQQRLAEFQEKLAAIRSQYPTLQGLHRRLKEARLI